MSQVVPFVDFQKLEIRVGKVVKAERIASSKKLIKLKVDIGNELRDIVAGVAEYYKPEELQEKNLIIMTNLEPRKVMGIQSQGMILAADVSGRPYVIFAEPSIPAGARVR
jgi:methionine--tRNA ligase beta chain